MEEKIKKQLPKTLVEPWIEALRSGRYKQCSGVLVGCNGYCCLGVYNAIHNENNNYTATTELLGSKDVNTFIDLNDDMQLPFPKIADYIEQNYELV